MQLGLTCQNMMCSKQHSETDCKSTSLLSLRGIKSCGSVSPKANFEDHEDWPSRFCASHLRNISSFSPKRCSKHCFGQSLPDKPTLGIQRSCWFSISQRKTKTSLPLSGRKVSTRLLWSAHSPPRRMHTTDKKVHGRSKQSGAVRKKRGTG